MFSFDVTTRMHSDLGTVRRLVEIASAARARLRRVSTGKKVSVPKVIGLLAHQIPAQRRVHGGAQKAISYQYQLLVPGA
jgi:hypothetical protein